MKRASPEGDLCHPVPPIYEDEATLKERLRRAHDGQRKSRVQLRYRLVTQRAQERQEVASLLRATSTPSAVGWPDMPPRGWMRYWRPTSPRANPSRSRPWCSPVWRAPSTSQKVWPRMRRYGTGCVRPMAWRSKTKRSPSWYTYASRPRSILVYVRFKATLQVVRADHTQKP